MQKTFKNKPFFLDFQKKLIHKQFTFIHTLYMFQYQKNAHGGVKAFTFYPNNANLVDDKTKERKFPHFVDCRCEFTNDIMTQPLSLTLSFISKIDYLEQSNEFFTIAITDKANQVYKFVFLKEIFCCDYISTPHYELEKEIKPEPEKVKIREQINQFIRAIHDNGDLELSVVKNKNLMNYFCQVKNWCDFS